MVTLETLITLENIVSVHTVSTDKKETTKLTESGCGEELKCQWNGRTIKVTIISLSPKWIQRTKPIKNLLKNIGLTLKKDQLSKESQSLMPNGSNDLVLCKHLSSHYLIQNVKLNKSINK